MSATRRRIRVDGDLSAGRVDVAARGADALHFARCAPGELVGAAVQPLTGELFDVSIGVKWFPLMMTPDQR